MHGEISHILGTCGENHPNILAALAGTLGLSGISLYIGYRWNQIISWFKNK